MHADLGNLGWTEEQWDRICSTVTEEAQRARVAAQILPVVGPEDPSTVAVPNFTLTAVHNPAQPPPRRLRVDSDPTLYLTTIAVNVPLRSHEVADPDLTAAMGMFRRAASYIARIEDALVFNGRSAPGTPPAQTFGIGGNPPPGIPEVYGITGDGDVAGVLQPVVPGPDGRLPIPLPPQGTAGQRIVKGIVDAIGQLEERAQLGPYACALSQQLFNDVCDPSDALVLPRDRVLPFLQGPLVRSSTIRDGWGAVIALSGNPVEIVVASDISVRFLQTTLEPRFVFRVSERVALRIREDSAIAVLRSR